MTNYFHKYKEYVIYLLIWTIMFLAPIISMYLEVRSGKEVDFNWRPVLGIWKIYIFYLLAFITHNFFLAPFLVYKKQAGRYFLLSTPQTAHTDRGVLHTDQQQRGRFLIQGQRHNSNLRHH